MRVREKIKHLGITAKELADRWGYQPQAFHAMSEEKFDYLLKIGGRHEYRRECEELRRRAAEIYYDDRFTARELYEALPKGSFAQPDSFRHCLGSIAFSVGEVDMLWSTFKKWKKIIAILEERIATVEQAMDDKLIQPTLEHLRPDKTQADCNSIKEIK